MIAETVDAGIYVISVTTTPSAWTESARLVRGQRRIRTALGLHPQLAHERSRELPLFEKLLPNCRYVGEIGLDGSPGYAVHAKVQQKVFSTILRMLAESGGRIMTIHSRGATDEVLSHLSVIPGAGVPILHWFSGTERQLANAIAMGCWFSVGPAMLRSAKGRKLASLMPRSRVLTETDGPFAEHMGRPLRPKDSWVAVRQLEELWSIDQQQVCDLLKDNLRQLATILPSHPIVSSLTHPPSLTQQ